MKSPVATRIQPDGAVYLYDANGHYCGSRRANSGKATSALVNGADLVITTDKGKTEVYACHPGGTFYKFSR